MPQSKKHRILVILSLALPLIIAFAGCGTLNMIGHARIHNDLIYPLGSLDPLDKKSAVVVEVDGRAARTAPLPALADTGPHQAVWVRAGMHLFKIKVKPLSTLPGDTSQIEYVTFSATVRSETSYLLFVVNGKPMLLEQRKGPGKNSLPPVNEPIPLTVVADAAAVAAIR